MGLGGKIKGKRHKKRKKGNDFKKGMGTSTIDRNTESV